MWGLKAIMATATNWKKRRRLLTAEMAKHQEALMGLEITSCYIIGINDY